MAVAPSTTEPAEPALPTTTRPLILHGDAITVLRTLPAKCVQTCVTSPPYWNLRDYGVPGQIGQESTFSLYVDNLMVVFREVVRVLRNDGTLWLNLGDVYINDTKWGGATSGKHAKALHGATAIGRAKRTTGLPPKSLLGLPWRVVFALQADGWVLRSDIVWSKPNPMPESVSDRPTRAHEFIFLLTKSARYFYDAGAIREPAKDRARAERLSSPSNWGDGEGAHGTIHPLTRGPRTSDKQRGHSRRHAGFNDRWDLMTKDEQQAMGANKRDVWEVATQPFPGVHFATFPERLIQPCILAGSHPGDLVLDPFLGSGTVAMVAQRYERRSIGIELNADYVEMAKRRCAQANLWSEGEAANGE